MLLINLAIVLDTWNMRDHIPMFTKINKLITTNHSITVYQSPDVSLWEMSGENFNRKHSCQLDQSQSMNIFPDTPKLIAYTTRSDPNTLIIYDLGFCKSIAQRTFVGRITVITISGNLLLLGFSSSYDILLSWDEGQLTPLMPFVSSYSTTMENGVIAYRKLEELEEATFFDAKTLKSSLIPIGFDFTSIQMSHDGSIAVVQKAGLESIAIYDVATKQKLLTADTQVHKTETLLYVKVHRFYRMFSASLHKTLSLAISWH